MTVGWVNNKKRMNGKMRGEIAERKNRKGKIMLKEIFTCCDYCYNCNCNEVSLNSISGVSEKDSFFLGEPSHLPPPSLIICLFKSPTSTAKDYQQSLKHQ